MRGREVARVAEVHRRVLAVEEAGLGQQEDARARRAQHRAARVHALQPLDQARVAALLPAGSRNSTDGTITMSLASIVSIERCTWIGTPLASSSGPADSPTISTWNGARAAVEADQRGRVHHVVDAGQRGEHRIGHRHQRDVAAGLAGFGDAERVEWSWSWRDCAAVARTDRSWAISTLP